MEETLLAIEKHGVSLVMALGMGYALYKVLMFMLVKKAEAFESSHEELKGMQIKTLERLTEIEKKIEKFDGELDTVRDFVMKGNNP